MRRTAWWASLVTAVIVVGVGTLWPRRSGADTPRAVGPTQVGSWQVVRQAMTDEKGLADNYRDLAFADSSHGWLLVDTAPYTAPMSNGASCEGYGKSQLLRTDDGGVTWSTAVETGTKERIGSIDFRRETGGWVVIGGPDLRTAIWRSLDGGRTWKKHSPQYKDIGQISAVSEAEAWGTGDGTPAVHTVDGGASWQWARLPRRIGDLNDTYFSAVFFLDPKHGWFARLDDAKKRVVVLRTSNGGVTWQFARFPCARAVPASSAPSLHER